MSFRNDTQRFKFCSWRLVLVSLLVAVAACSTPARDGDSAAAANARSSSEIETQEVLYKAGDSFLTGYLAMPKEAKDRPAVLVVHEWWGQTDYPRKRAEMLAELGYVAFAVDMYGNRRTADHPEDAGKFAQETMKDIDVVTARFQAAMDVVKKLPQVDKDQIAAIGYCFGGGVVLQMARRGLDLDGVVSFHGTLATPKPAKKGQIKADILVLNGAADSMVTKENLAAFEKEMKQAGADYEIINYPGAKHGFTNPVATEKGKTFNIPLEYNKEADQKSWEEMKDFLNRIFNESEQQGESTSAKRTSLSRSLRS